MVKKQANPPWESLGVTAPMTQCSRPKARDTYTDDPSCLPDATTMKAGHQWLFGKTRRVTTTKPYEYFKYEFSSVVFYLWFDPIQMYSYATRIHQERQLHLFVFVGAIGDATDLLREYRRGGRGRGYLPPGAFSPEEMKGHFSQHNRPRIFKATCGNTKFC